MAAVLRYHVQAQESYAPGETISITFTLENTSGQDLWVLTWYTPLEGIKGNIFDLKCNGQTLRYRGRMLKRGEPRQEDYVHLPPGGSVSRAVDLSEAYDLAPGKRCRLRFRGDVLDVYMGQQLIRQPGVKPQSMVIAGNAVTFTIKG